MRKRWNYLEITSLLIGVFTTIRASRGQDIFAACGLLSTAKERKKQLNNKYEKQMFYGK